MANRYYTKDNDKFINPYNFVSLPDKIKRSTYENGHLTGYLTVSLTTMSPLFIPNTTNDAYFKNDCTGHKSYDFYSYVDLKGKKFDEKNKKYYSPVIPGSELRGVLRTIHEIQNDSCFGDLIDRNRTFATRAKPKDNFQPYFIFWDNERNEYYCVEAEEVPHADLKSFKKENEFYDKTGTIFQENDNLTPKKVKEKKIVYFRKGEEFNKEGKKKISKKVYSIKNIAKDELTDVEILCFKNVLEEYSNERINNHLKKNQHSGYLNLKESFEHHQPILVFIKKINGFHLISPAAIGKYMVKNTLDDILTKGKYESCSDIQNSCPTCQLFGFVNKDKSTSHSSRIRFTDATTSRNAEECYMDPITLKPLLSPHPSYALFYGLKKENEIKKLERWYDPIEKISIRGRKLYFHSKFNKDDFKDIPSELNNTIHPVKEGVTFHFDIYFEDITEKQLDQLIKCVNLYNDEKTKKYGHKIGHAKPFGFGSVYMNVDKITYRKIIKDSNGIRYDEYSDIVKKHFNPETSEEKQLKIMTDISMSDERICYPYSYSYSKNDKYLKKDKNGYSWFMYNDNCKAPQELPILKKICEEQNAKEKLKLKSNVKERKK